MHPIIFQWKNLTIYSYGFFVAVAMAVSLLIAERRARHFGVEASQAADLLFVLFIGGILGARVLYVWQNFGEYSKDLWSILRFQEGGLVWYGGFFGAVFCGIFYARWRGWPVLKLADFFAPMVALAHGIGRVGCFFNGCCYGLRTDSAWGVHFPGQPYANLPTQLYEAAGLFVISGILFYFSSKPRRQGQVFLAYLFLYAFLRFIIEFFRGDNLHYFHLTLAQWMSIGIFVSTLFIFMTQKKNK